MESINVNTSQKSDAYQSVTYILSGSLLYLFNGLAGGWTSGLAAMLGFYLLLKGISLLKSSLDEVGQGGLQLIRTAAIIGLIASVIDLFPLTSWLAALGFMAVFILEVLGLLRLKNSMSIGIKGREGASQLIIAMVIAIVGAAISMIPFFGGITASFFALVAMFLSISGWLKIQKGVYSA